MNTMTGGHRPLVAMMTAALLCGLLFNCGGGGGGNVYDQKRETLRGDYHKNPQQYRDKWGLDK